MKEKSLSESPAEMKINYKTIFETTSAPFLILSPNENFTIIAANDAYLRATYTQREAIIGKSVFEVFPDNPDERGATGTKNLRASLERVLQAHTVDTIPIHKYDIPRPSSQGGGFEPRFWSAISKPVLNPQGAIDYIIHRVEDVTSFMLKGAAQEELTKTLQTRSDQMQAETYRHLKELENAQEALKQNNEHYQTLTAMLPVGIFHMNTEGHCLYANPQAQKIAGIEVNKAESKYWFNLVHPADRQQAQEIWQACLQSSGEHVCKLECRFLLPGSQERWALIQVAPEFNKAGQVHRVIGAAVDIDKRKRLEEEQRKRADILTKKISNELRQSSFELQQKASELEEAKAALSKSEEDFRIVMSKLPFPVVRFDTEGNITFVNQAGCTLLQLQPEEIKGRNWLKHIHPEDRERTWNTLQETISQKRIHLNQEFRYVRADGTSIWAMREAVAEVDAEGQLKGYLSTWTDISNLKKLEAERLEASQQAAEQQLKRAEEAETYRKRQEQFIDTMCHELRNPLNGIYGNVNLLESSIATLEKLIETPAIMAPEEMRQAISKHIAQEKESLRAIDTCARHQKAITDDTLNLSKLEAGKVKLNPTDFNPKDVVKDVVDILDTETKRKGTELYVKAPHSTMIVNGDRHRLSQVLLNLASNAVKFTPEGGKITISLQPEKVAKDEVVLKFIVKDTGIGMTEAEKAKLFNRFEQATHATYAEYGGSGLGLVISKHLIELMGGKIDVESEKGKGTKFAFTIKCQPAMVLLKAPPPSASLFTGGAAPKVHRHILVVEDNVINQKILKRNLEQAGHSCEIANNGKEAYEMAEKTSYDVVLMDVEMPMMDGLEATKLIRQKEREQKKAPVPIIGLSGNAREEYIATAQQAGMNDYLTKPYERTVLLEKIAFYTLPPLTAKRTERSAPLSGDTAATTSSSSSLDPSTLSSSISTLSNSLPTPKPP